MSIIYILIPIAVLLTALGVYLFFWAVKTEQFDDLEKQGMSILFEDDKASDESVVSSNDKRKVDSEYGATCDKEITVNSEHKQYQHTVNNKHIDK